VVVVTSKLVFIENCTARSSKTVLSFRTKYLALLAKESADFSAFSTSFPVAILSLCYWQMSIGFLIKLTNSTLARFLYVTDILVANFMPISRTLRPFKKL